MESAMENPSDEALFVANGNITQNYTFNNEEDMPVVDKGDSFREEQREMILDQNNGDSNCNNSLNEVNVTASELYSEVMTDKDILFSDKKDKTINPENEQDSGVFEDILRQECEILNENSSSLKEHNQSSDNDIFPILNKEDIHNSVEEELAFHKGIEDDGCDDELPLDKAGIFADSSLSSPPTPKEDTHESDDELDDEERKELRSTRKDLSLPYFQLPKPDLDEFLIETEKNLDIPVKSHENKISERSPAPCKPKQKNIVSLKPPPDVKGNFFDPKKVFITFDLSSDSYQVGPSKESSIPQSKPEVSSGSLNNEYEKVLSSLDADEKTPGIKRLALKEFLKQKIDQKKYEAFNQSKILNIVDEEMEELFEKDEDPETADEDSSDEYEEATVSFEKNDQKIENGAESGDENALAEEPEEFQLSDENSCESDEDFIGVRKTKKKFLVLDDDSCNSDNFSNEKKKDCELLDMENSSSSDSELPDIVEIMLAKKSDKLNFSDTDVSNRHSELTKNGESAFGEGIFQTSENNSIFSQISSSMPSYQPGGGFLNQDHREDSSDSIISTTSQQNMNDNINEENEDLYMPLEPKQNLFSASKTLVSENECVLGSASVTHNDDSNTFGIKLDDLPVSQSVDDSNIFLTEELADVCSGVFNKEIASSEKIPEKDLKYAFQEKVTDFFDDEAELSGEDDGIDDKDDSGDEAYNLDLYASDEENLPAAEVLREEIADLHMKRLMDDDEERIKEIQEQFLDDGELNNDGTGRARRFAWMNNDVEIAPAGDNSDSDSDADAIDDSLALKQEKAKWQQENKEDENEDLSEELNSSGYRRKSFLKVDIIGKPKFSHEDSARRLSWKRPRGSYLNLDDSSASQVLKKLKASEDNFGGSRTTKHFVFRNDLPEVSAAAKQVPVKSVTMDSSSINQSPKIKSVFAKI